jgi:general secretion pathway protein L
MSVLVIQIPPRSRFGSRSAAEPAARPPTEFDYVFSNDGLTVVSSGRCASALLPRADSLLALLADVDVGWHRIQVPKAPVAKLRAALAGTLEEFLLEDEEVVHFALAPQVTPGQTGWVAAIHKPWLSGVLTELEAAGRVVDRVLPSSAPGDGASGHFFLETPGDASPMLALAHADGAVCLRTGGSLARALLPADGSTVRWTASPAAAAGAERWLGSPVNVLGDAERALQAARSLWNLRQFDLAPRHRGTLALREALRRLLSPAWRPVRFALIGLVVVQLLGLNVFAFRQQRAVDARRAEMSALLRSAHPGVRAVIDPVLQMRRETENLRAAAGRTGDGDLEVLLGAAAAAWPDGQGPVQTLRFEPGKLTLTAPGWGEPQVAQFRERLRPAGFAVEMAEGRVTLSRSSGGTV